MSVVLLYGTYETVRARLWPCLSSQSPLTLRRGKGQDSGAKGKGFAGRGYGAGARVGGLVLVMIEVSP